MTAPTAHHVGLTVSDLDRSIDFYRDVLGLDVLDRFAVSGEAFSDAVDVDDATGRFAHLDGDGARIELVEYEPSGDELPGADLNDAGAVHLGLSVEDVDGVVDRLPSDVETLSEPRTTDTGTRICFLRDPDGNPIELLEL